MIYDYIILGGGLAGTILYDFLKARHSVLVIDHDSGTHGSRVAAGIYNPVTGRRMVKAWMAETFSEFALEYYHRKETEWNTSFVNRLNISRLFHNVEQRKEWMDKIDFYDIDHLIAQQIEADEEDPAIHRSFGGVETKSSWRLDTEVFLTKSRETLEETEALLEAAISYDKIAISDDGTCSVDNYTAHRLIFCEGWQMVNNPWFNYLPIVPNKGELLLIKAPDLQEERLLQKGMFVLPIGNDLYKVGATYDKTDQSYTPTEKSKTWLVERLERVIKTPYEILAQKAGIRPTVKDRRPLLGQHPKHPQLFLFNGFGSKGVSQAPWCAQHFVRNLTHGEDLMEELSIQRFYAEGPFE